MKDFIGIASNIKSYTKKDGKNVVMIKQREAIPTPSRQSSKVFACFDRLDI
jgi:hypothetical protein